MSAQNGPGRRISLDKSEWKIMHDTCGPPFLCEFFNLVNNLFLYAYLTQISCHLHSKDTIEIQQKHDGPPIPLLRRHCCTSPSPFPEADPAQQKLAASSRSPNQQTTERRRCLNPRSRRASAAEQRAGEGEQGKGKAMMSRGRAALASIRLADLLLSSRRRTARALWTQVSHSSPSPSLPSTHPHGFLFNLHERFRFSTKPDSILDLVAANQWSAELESQLGDLSPALSHETVVYVLKKLDRDPVKASGFFHWASGRDGFCPSSSLYSMLLRILGKKESMKQFWFALKKMKEQGFYLDEETYVTILGAFKKGKMASDAMGLTHFYKRMIEENGRDSVVKKLVELVLGKAWSSEAEKALADMNVAFSDTMVIRILKELRNYPAKA